MSDTTTCTRCGGSGEVPLVEAVGLSPASRAPSNVVCPDCGGTGDVLTTPTHCQVEYVVPVIALVNLVDGTVERVVVIDEEVRLRDTDNVLGYDTERGVPFPTTNTAAMEHAIRIAEGDPDGAGAEWPSWEFGW